MKTGPLGGRALAAVGLSTNECRGALYRKVRKPDYRNYVGKPATVVATTSFEDGRQKGLPVLLLLASVFFPLNILKQGADGIVEPSVVL